MPASNLVTYKDVPKVDNERICPVCTDEAPPGETHHPHYGAICCYSCKAFFRRAHQRTRSPLYVCKRDGKCVIFPKCKQHCKRCRYNKCIQAGMDPKWVMTNDEKRIRFKNFFKKKDEQQALAGMGTTDTPQAAISHTASGNRRRNRSHPHESRGNASTSTTTAEVSPALTILEPRGEVRALQRRMDPEMSARIPQTVTSVVRQSSISQSVEMETEEITETRPFQQGFGFNDHIPQSSFVTYLPPSNLIRPVNQPLTVSQTVMYLPNALIRINHADIPSSAQVKIQNALSGCAPVPNHLGYQVHAAFGGEQGISSMTSSSLAPQTNVFHDHQSMMSLPIERPQMSESYQQSQNHELIPVSAMIKQEKSVANSETEDTASNQPIERAIPNLDTSYRSNFLSLRSQLSNILDAFTLITGKLCLTSDLSQDLIMNHQRQKPMQKTTLLTQLSMIASTLTEFASSQFLFSSLCKEDQTALLKNNIPLYLQYVLARYFSADTGLEQLNWILEGQICIESIEVVTSLSRISLREFNASVNLFTKSETLEIFSHLVENIGMFYSLPQHCNGLIANMLLYLTGDTMTGKLKEYNRITCIFKEAKELVKLAFDQMDRRLNCEGSRSIGPLIYSLAKMKTIFGECRVQGNCQEGTNCIPKLIELNYTEAEECWIQRKFCQFQEEYISVSPPKEYFVQLVNLLGKNIQVSDHFVASWMGMESERVRRVLKIHPEFLSLSDKDQKALWSKNQLSAIALAAVRINVVTSGKEQFKHIVGVLNYHDKSWENQYKDTINLDALRYSNLSKREVNSGKMDKAVSTCFLEVTKDLAEMCFNPQMYQLFTLLTLLDTEGLSESSSFLDILKTRQIYMKVFQRKLTKAGCSFVDYAHFRRTLKKIKIVANIMENFLQ